MYSQFWVPSTRKSPVSCLMRKSHVSWDFLLGFIEKAWDMRISHETGDFLSRQETGDFLIGGGQKLIRHKIFSWDMRFSHETGDRRFSHWGDPKLKRHEVFFLNMRFCHETRDRRFSCWGGTKNWLDMRFSLETWDFPMRQETGDFLVGGGTQNW